MMEGRRGHNRCLTAETQQSNWAVFGVSAWAENIWKRSENTHVDAVFRYSRPECEHRPLPFSRDATNPVCLLLHKPETYFFNTFSLWQEGAAIREPKRNMFNKNGYKLNVCCESASAFERSKMDIYLSGKSHNSNQSALPTAQSFLCWRCHMSPLLMLVPTAHWEWWKDYLIRCTSKPSSISCVGCSSQVNIVIDWIEKNNIFEHFTVSRSSTTALCAGHAVHPRRTSGRNQTTGIQCLTSIQCCCFL